MRKNTADDLLDGLYNLSYYVQKRNCTRISTSSRRRINGGRGVNRRNRANSRRIYQLYFQMV